MDVLLADDDALVREALAETLTDAGLIVAAAASAEDALRIAEAEPAPPPSVLVTDVDLGAGMDGHALAGACRRRWPALAVVFISGEPDSFRARDPGPRGVFLAKPLRPAQLVRQVLGWVAAAPPPPAPPPPPIAADDDRSASDGAVARRAPAAFVDPTAAPSAPAWS